MKRHLSYMEEQAMVTKVNRTKAAERIEKAKQLHGLAESKTDSILVRLMDSPFTLAILCGAFIAAFVSGYLVASC